MITHRVAVAKVREEHTESELDGDDYEEDDQDHNGKEARETARESWVSFSKLHHKFVLEFAEQTVIAT